MRRGYNFDFEEAENVSRDDESELFYDVTQFISIEPSHFRNPSVSQHTLNSSYEDRRS